RPSEVLPGQLARPSSLLDGAVLARDPPADSAGGPGDLVPEEERDRDERRDHGLDDQAAGTGIDVRENDVHVAETSGRVPPPTGEQGTNGEDPSVGRREDTTPIMPRSHRHAGRSGPAGRLRGQRPASCRSRTRRAATSAPESALAGTTLARSRRFAAVAATDREREAASSWSTSRPKATDLSHSSGPNFSASRRSPYTWTASVP